MIHISESADARRAREAGVETKQTVSKEPDHSSLPAQESKDLEAEPTPTGDPVVQEAQGIEPA